MSDRRHDPEPLSEQPFQLLWAPPSYPSFELEDLVRFRLLLNYRGWCLGLVWHAHEKPGQAAKAGITWNTSSKLKDSIWSYLSECADEGIDAGHAYAAVADSPGAFWSDEIVTFGFELMQARLWMQRFSDDETRAGGVPLPPRAAQWSWADPDGFTFHVATRPGEAGKTLIACGPEVLLLREECKWWIVPDNDASVSSVSGSQLVEVRPGFHVLHDELGPSVLHDAAIVSAFSPSWAGDMWSGAPEAASAQGELHFWVNDNDEPLGLLLGVGGRVYLRGEGRWFPLPKDTPLMACISATEVDCTLIPIWDEYEFVDRQHEISLQLAEALPPKQNYPTELESDGVAESPRPADNLIPDNAHRRTRSCCVSMRSRRSRRSIGPVRSCR